MNKSLNIFAILLFIACVNSTKTVSYSEIVTNLVQLSDDKSSGLSHLNIIVENFKNANNDLTKLKTSVSENCNKLELRGKEFIENLNKEIIRFNKEVERLEAENKKITTDLVSDRKAITGEAEKIKKATNEIESTRRDTLANEKEIQETINVLKRLKNIAIDELQGIEKKATAMDKFNVDSSRSTPVSFLETHNFQAELKGLLSNSDSVNRGLISTLILLTQSAGKATYSNPETVRKIVSMIEKIIDNSNAKKAENVKNGEENVKKYNEIIENSRNSITRFKEEVASKINAKAVNEKEIVFFKNDIIFFTKAVNRRTKRNEFSLGLCLKQAALIDVHFNRYKDTLSKVDQLKDEISAQ